MTYDQLALAALLDPDDARARVAVLRSQAYSCVPCPDCGHEGPHDQHYLGGIELQCGVCGTMFEEA